MCVGNEVPCYCFSSCKAINKVFLIALLFQVTLAIVKQYTLSTFLEYIDHAIVSDHVIERPEVRSAIQCAYKCIQVPGCVSFTAGDNVCELTDVLVTNTGFTEYTESFTGRNIYTVVEGCVNGGYMVKGSCWCVGGFAGVHCQTLVQDCTEAGLYHYYQNITHSIQIKPHLATSPFHVVCNNNQVPGRTIFMIRKNNVTDFNRDWESYKEGFGDFSKPWAFDIWVGLENLHVLTNSRRYRLRLVASWNPYSAQFYHNFTVSGEAKNYTMNYTSSSPASTPPLGDAFVDSKEMPFSTYDKDSTRLNCPVRFGSGWWFSTSTSESCSYCNPMGIPGSSPTYQRSGTDTEIFFNTEFGDWAPHMVLAMLEYFP